jgi:hypothetical protein
MPSCSACARSASDLARSLLTYSWKNNGVPLGAACATSASEYDALVESFGSC